MRTLIVLVFAACCTVACHPGTNGQPARTVRVDSGGFGSALVAHPVYQSALEALKAALEADDLQIGRATLARLMVRLESDRASLPSMIEAKGKDDALSLQVLSGELPSREHAVAGLRIADGFMRVLEGRTRLREIELTVVLRRVPGTETCRASLFAISSWPETLVIMPGPATLEVLRTSLEPRTGVERRDSSKTHLDAELSIEIPAGGSTSTPIADIPIEVPIGAIATRLRIGIVFTGGTLSEDGETFPARDIAVETKERTDIASWVPATLVDPQELVRVWKRGDASLASILERTVRIPPARYEEVLDRLGLTAEIQPVQTFSVIVPALRWIVRTHSFGRDEGSWRRWLLARLDDRRMAGTVFGE